MTTDDHNKLGTARLEKGEYDEAISELTKVILGILPGLADAHYKRSLAYRHKGEYDLAIADFQKVALLTKNPELVKTVTEEIQNPGG